MALHLSSAALSSHAHNCMAVTPSLVPSSIPFSSGSYGERWDRGGEPSLGSGKLRSLTPLRKGGAQGVLWSPSLPTSLLESTLQNTMATPLPSSLAPSSGLTASS